MRSLFAAATLIAVALAMAGCGVRGPLEPPPGVAPAPAPTTAPSGAVTKPSKPFVLDGIL